MTRRWIARILFAILAALVMLPTSGLYFLLTTPSGLRWLSEKLQATIPGTLVIKDIQGNLLHRIEIRGLRYELPPHRVEADEVVLAWEPEALLTGHLHVLTLQTRHVRYAVPAAREEEKKPASPLPEIRLPLAVDVDELIVEDAAISHNEQEYRIKRFSASAGINENGAFLHNLDISMAEGKAGSNQPDKSGQSDNLNLSFHAAGTGSLLPPYPLSLSMEWSAGGVPTVEKLKGAGHIKGDLNQIKVNYRSSLPFPLIIAGQINPKNGQPSVNIQGEWENAKWPLTEEEGRWQSRKGSFALQGGTDDYSVEINANVIGKDIPATDIQLRADGDRQGLQMESLRLATLGGLITAQGKTGWAPFAFWDLDIRAEHVNPGIFWREWPGELAMEGHTKGKVEDAPVLSVEIPRLEGKLRDYPMRVIGKAGLADGTWTFPEMELVSGDNRLNLKGSLGENTEIDLALHARNLAALWPGLTGSLQGEAKLSGKLVNPAVDGHFTGTAIRFDGYSLQGLDLEVQFDPANPKTSHAKLEASDLAIQTQRISKLTLQGSGELSHSDWQANLEAGLAKIALALNVRHQEEYWHGEINSLDLDVKEYGLWRLDAPVSASFASGTATIGQTCFAHEKTRLCIEGTRQSAGNLDIKGSLQTLPLSIAEKFIPKTLLVEGLVDGQFSAHGPPDRLTANVKLSPSDGTVTYKPPKGEPFGVAYRDTKILADYVDNRLSVNLGLSIAEDGRIDSAVALGPFQPGQDWPITGKVRASLPNLHLLSAFIPKADDLQGSFHVDASLGGTVNEPMVTGRAEIRDAAAKIPELGVRIENIQLSVENQGMDRLVLSGGLRSGAGDLSLKGEARLSASAGWPMELTLQGKDFEIIRRPEANALLSPDMKLTFARGAATVNGTITVPKALVEIKEMPKGAVQVSEDEIIVNGKGEKKVEAAQEKEKNGLPLTSQVTITLGKEVSFRGFGLKTRLTGSLEVKTSPRRPAFAHGALELVEGRYKAYGQDLSIDQGRFLFNGPMDNPSLEIRAVRKAGEILAGIRIRGSAKDPRTEIFSEPSMSQNEALSYLLTGRAPGKNGADSAMLTQAALSMGLDRSEGFIQSVGQTLGLDTLGVEAGESLEQTSLALGKYLTPDLYVSYVLGLFDKEGAIELRYRLTESLSIKARSGKTQSMDLIYSIER